MISSLPIGQSQVVLASAARTVTTTSQEIQVPEGATGFIITHVCTAAGAAGSVKAAVNSAPTGSSGLPMVTDTVGFAAATGGRVLSRSALAAEPPSTVHSSGSIFGDRVQIVVTHATADSYTYSVRIVFLK